MIDLNENATFAITADSGELERQAVLLVRSIKRYAPDANVVVFIPRASRGEVSGDALATYRSAGSVVWGEIPISEYPISALLGAFVAAEERSETEYLVAMDTDTLLLDRLRVQQGGDVWLRPVDVGAQYWGSQDSMGDWKQLYERFGLSIPDRGEYVEAAIDGRAVPPYWNSGVTITTDRSLPERWLRYTKEMYYDDELPVSRDEFFIDQLSLSVATARNEVQELDERTNYPLGGRLSVPSNVSVIHYGDRRNLARVFSQPVRRELRESGAIPDITSGDMLRTLLDVCSTKSGRVLDYEQKNRLRGLVSAVLPQSVVDR
ncbi:MULTISPECIES: hypothetical protein [Halolamina]|uniref:Glycosyl transferase family 8 n=1 Tax=Halolamina pelagica TaxID=699431 RepID=A0A1I5QXN7_9EURY|nr:MULTISPECIES: hypothetical protein [Halolamina]NHX35596.1 hypothetical protein [Halolamina sp. R1-12]SFP51013.1 hypothetical protein SAMN05216277_104142 [Halolamina pelagica]